MALGLLDLSLVTARLIELLFDARDNGPIIQPDPFTLEISGKPPDRLPKGENCQLGLYLFHVVPDRFQRNAPVTGPSVPPLPAQPLSLDLYYLLTACSPEGLFDQEQRAMSMALRCFYENPVVQIKDAANNELARVCLTMEVESADELGRLWQAAATSLRVSAVYKVSVVFLQAPAPRAPAKDVLDFTLSVHPVAPGDAPFIAGTVATVLYLAPGHAPGDLSRFDLFPARVAAGQSFFLYGSGFDTNDGKSVYLLTPAGAEEDVTSWRNAARSTAGRHALTVPATDTHAAGVYQLRVGNNKPLADPLARRSAATPFSLAPLVDATGGPLLPAPAPGNPFVVTGGGFSPGQAEVDLDTVSLRPRTAAGNPVAGEFRVVDATTIQFVPPAGLPAGQYAVRVRVNDVESLPAKWVNLP